ncbi:type II secretion system major pseudopilin GspG [Parahaliea maris]|nr:type II secretion system major pseudopilin GspG [Parahaliea maris]
MLKQPLAIMLKHLLATLPLAVLLGACADPAQEATEAVTAAFGPKGTTEISEIEQYPSGVLCGMYERFDRWGESSSKRRFVYVDGEARVRPSREDLAVYCAENPKQVVEAMLGIPVSGDSAAHTARAAADMAMLAATLERYYMENGGYPSTEQGLASLVSKPESAKPLDNYPEGGYLEALPKDPWNRPYVYEGPAWGGVRSPYQLQTYGADGKPGGSGPDADIRSDKLEYLAFAAGL